MGRAYSMRLRLRPRVSWAVTDPASLEALFVVLDQQGVAEDVSDVGADGTYIVWLTLTADDLQEAVGQSVICLEDAQRKTRPTAPLDEVISIEVSVAPTNSDDSPSIPAAI